MGLFILTLDVSITVFPMSYTLTPKFIYRKDALNMNINIKGLNKAEVLLALWRGSHSQGISFFGRGEGSFTLEMAEKMVSELTKSNHRLYFDYVYGHVIKCDITDDTFDDRLYARDCGEGTSENVIEFVRKGKLDELKYESYDSDMTKSLLQLLGDKHNTEGE